MGGRTRSRWAVLVGGPLDGRREVLAPYEVQGAIVRHTDTARYGWQVAHLYVLTAERRKGGFHESVAVVATFVRTVGEVQVPSGITPARQY